MTLRQKQGLILLLTVVGLVLALWHPNVVVMAAGIMLLLAASLLYLVWIRCPECGKWLDRDPGNFCKHCGAQIPWDEKKKRNL